ncbi:MAG: BufA1 family periplasmic bufferin-type metallophore [Burkholderiales bacterium]
MSSTDRIIRSAFASLLALGVTLTATQALAANPDEEKCAGIIKAGFNDCGTSHGHCAGTIEQDGDSEAWIYVPKGTCEKIVGAHLSDSKFERKGHAQE